MDSFVAPDRLVCDDFLLRSFQPGDGVALAEATNASYEHLRHQMPWAVRHDTAEACEQRARRFRADWLTAAEFHTGIWSPEESRLLGGTGFHLGRTSDYRSGVAEIGMWIRAEEANRGLGTRVLGEMLRWGFTDWPWYRLSWQCDAANEPSCQVAISAGMRLEGTLRGEPTMHGEGRRTMHVFGLTRPELGRRPAGSNDASGRPAVGQVVTVFRNRLRTEAADTYAAELAVVVDLARAMPGFVETKTFTAEDGERVTVVTFADQASHAGWRDHPRHRTAQRRGIEEFYSEYSIAVGQTSYASSWSRAGASCET